MPCVKSHVIEAFESNQQPTFWSLRIRIFGGCSQLQHNLVDNRYQWWNDFGKWRIRCQLHEDIDLVRKMKVQGWCWLGHVECMGDIEPQKFIYLGPRPDGRRREGRPADGWGWAKHQNTQYPKLEQKDDEPVIVEMTWRQPEFDYRFIPPVKAKRVHSTYSWSISKLYGLTKPSH